MLAFTTLATSDAVAGNVCPESAGDPVQFEYDDVSGSCNDVCKHVDLGSTFAEVCTLGSTGTESGGGWAVAIYDPGYAGGSAICGSEYCAWGETHDGTDFFCPWDHTETIDMTSHTLVRVVLEGTDHTDGDHLMFQWSTYDLESWSTSDALTGLQNAKAGPDVLHGSRECSAGYYTDDLEGDEGEDTLCGYDCADLLDGAADDDILCGMLGGNDSLEGGGGHNDYLDHGGQTGDTNDGGPGGNDYCNSSGDPNCENDIPMSGGDCD